MTTGGLRAAREHLVALPQRFAPRLGRKEARAHSTEHLRGLLSPARGLAGNPRLHRDALSSLDDARRPRTAEHGKRTDPRSGREDARHDPGLRCPKDARFPDRRGGDRTGGGTEEGAHARVGCAPDPCRFVL
jgi:hypothetical protein